MMFSRRDVSVVRSFALTLVLFAASCNEGLQAPPATGPKAPANPSVNAQDQTLFNNPQATLASIQYPAAVVIEGGKGKPNFDAAFEKHQPEWRLYLCLKASDDVQTDKYVFNSAELGGTLFARGIYSNKQLQYKERLTQATLRYRYKATMVRDDRQGYANGRLSFVSDAAEQTWEELFKSSEFDNQDLNLLEFRALDFDVRHDEGATTYMAGQYYSFSTEEEERYLRMSVQFFVFDQKDQIFEPIKECEKRKQDTVLLFGDEIPRDF